MKQGKCLNKLVHSLVLCSVFGAQVALADCDFSTGVQKQDSGYLYSVDCHKQVGKIVKDLDDREKQVQSLSKSIDLKDLALEIQDERANRLRETLYRVEDRVNTMERIKESNKWLYFGIGIAFTGLAVWGAGQLK